MPATTLGPRARPLPRLLFLRYTDFKFAQAKAKLTSQGIGRRTIGKADYHARGLLYLPESARFANLLAVASGDPDGHRRRRYTGELRSPAPAECHCGSRERLRHVGLFMAERGHGIDGGGAPGRTPGGGEAGKG